MAPFLSPGICAKRPTHDTIKKHRKRQMKQDAALHKKLQPPVAEMVSTANAPQPVSSIDDPRSACQEQE